MKIDVLCYDAFTDKEGMGNPAGVCLEAEGLTAEQMQEVAFKVGYNESAFVVKPDVEGADYRFRFFMPGREVDLCGHATMATTVALARKLALKERTQLKIQTNAGLLDVTYDPARNEVLMEQANARFDAFDGSIADLFSKMELPADCYDDRYPIMYGSTGAWTVVIPVKGLETCRKMVPHNDEFKDVLTLHPLASLHCFCTETMHGECLLHARHFSASGAGTVEDPVTGTASGVMSAYYIQYMHPELQDAEFLIEQGQDMGRDGFCRTFASRQADGAIAVKIAGTAVTMATRTVEIAD